MQENPPHQSLELTGVGIYHSLVAMRNKLVLGLISLVFLISCNNEPALFFVDSFADRLTPEPGVSQLWKDSAWAHGWNPRVVVLPPSAFVQETLKILAAQKPLPKTVFLSAIYSGPLFQSIRAAYPEMKIIVIGGPDALVTPLTWVVRSDRTAAFEELGERLAHFVQAQNPQPKTAVSSLFYLRLAERQSERDFFINGWKKILPQDQLFHQDLYQLRDPEALRRLIQTSESTNPLIYALFASTMNAESLRIIQRRDAIIVTEDWVSSGLAESQVLLSVERDWKGIFDTAFDDLKKNQGKSLKVAAKIFENKKFKISVKK